MLLLVVVAIFFVNYVISNEFISAQKYLEQSVLQTASNLRGRINSSIKEMELLSAKLTNYAVNYNEKEIGEFLEKYITDYDYYSLIFAYKDGIKIKYERDKGLTTVKSKNADDISLYKSEFFATVKNQHVPSGYVNEFRAPVYNKDNKYIGIISSEVFADKYIKILLLNNYDKKGYSYIIDSDGNFIVKTQKYEFKFNNFFEFDNKYIGTTLEKVKNNLKSKQNGSFLFKYKNRKYVAAYSVIDNQNRIVFTIIPLYVLLLHVDKLLGGITLIVLLISLLLFAMYYYSNILFKQNERMIYDMVFTDQITGGGNKNKFLVDANEILHDNNNAYALIFIDIAHFKSINELYGSEHTNKIIKDVYEIICNNLSEGSICVRDYASKFVVLYEYENQDFIVSKFINNILEDVKVYNENKMEQVSENFDILRKAKLSFEFGIYLISDKTVPVDIMCERANIAKQNVKGNVNIRYKFYDDNLRAQILLNKAIEDEMYSALESGQFKMYLQPKFDIETRTLKGAEALVRWIHPDKGIIPPNNFIPLFEENGFIVELDKCIWSQTFEFLAKRKNEGKQMFPISVNVSRFHLNNDAFISELVLLTQKYDVPPEYIELELTESACFNDEKRFRDVLSNLKSHGFILSMDDFGTGYSSLNILRHLPFDVLKIDRGFIVDAVNDERGGIILKSIIDMANQLNMTTLAEGIEMEEQLIFLKNLGCKLAQGFYFGRPVDVETFCQMFLSDGVDIKNH